jgi:hypothetical protein
MGVIGLLLLAAGVGAADAGERFRAAGEQALAGDHLKAIALYGELQDAGVVSASLYWNWAQAAAARGAAGEALWACLRARELSPGDRAIARQIEELRQSLNLDPAELAPQPLAAVGRQSRRFHLDLAAVVLLAVSLTAHIAARFAATSRRAPALAWTALALSLLATAAPLVAAMSGRSGVVVRRGASLWDAASPSASAIGLLREGEVVPILQETGDYVRIEDSSGARGWARTEDVRVVERAPRPRN